MLFFKKLFVWCLLYVKELSYSIKVLIFVNSFYFFWFVIIVIVIRFLEGVLLLIFFFLMKYLWFNEEKKEIDFIFYCFCDFNVD